MEDPRGRGHRVLLARSAILTAEAIRLTRLLSRLQPGETEVAGLLALMLLTDVRRAARTDGDGRIVPLPEQRRDLWDATAFADGQAVLTRVLGTGPVGPYQLQAAIAELHDEAPTAGQTDWPQILALPDVLAMVAPGPVVTLSRAVALAMVHGPRAGLALLGTLDEGDRIACTTAWNTLAVQPDPPALASPPSLGKGTVRVVTRSRGWS